jgi:hypothetical protein
MKWLNATSIGTNSTYKVLVSKPGHRGELSAANRLSHGPVPWFFFFNHNAKLFEAKKFIPIQDLKPVLHRPIFRFYSCEFRKTTLSAVLFFIFTKSVCRSRLPRGPSVRLRPLGSWDCGFEFRRRHGCLCLVSVVRCHVGFLATGRSFVQRSPTECVCVCHRVWSGSTTALQTYNK